MNQNGTETSELLLRAINELAKEINEDPDTIWADGHTKNVGPERTEEILLEILNTYDTPTQNETELFWGYSGVFAEFTNGEWELK